MSGAKHMQAVEIINRCVDDVISVIRSEMYSGDDDPERNARVCCRLTLKECPHLLDGVDGGISK